MDRNDEILEKIDIILAMDTEKPSTEFGYFVSRKDRAYRNEAMIQMFSGLKRENQDVLLESALRLLCNQIAGSDTISFDLLPQGGVFNE